MRDSHDEQVWLSNCIRMYGVSVNWRWCWCRRSFFQPKHNSLMLLLLLFVCLF